MNDVKNSRINFPNLLLIAGNGRNVGKTWLVCQLIKKFSKSRNVVAIKISSHFHPVDEDAILIQNEHFTIANETKINSKDSSQMLQAGAQKVYFIMSPQQHLNKAFNTIKEELENEIVICESGGLNEFVKPGIFLFVMKHGDLIKKPHLLHFHPIIINNDGQNIDFEISDIIIIENGKFQLK